jgi:FkbM family methyltransferase
MANHIKAAITSALSSRPELLAWVRRAYIVLGLGAKAEVDFLFDLARKQKNVFALQVGANDGVSHDPIHHYMKNYGWHGLLLEPLPDIFERLQRNYQSRDGVILCNAALADRDGAMTFYRINPGPEVPEFCQFLGSFSRETILWHKHLFPAIESHIVEQQVEALSFSSLVERHGISKIDVILIDTEGYDFEILKQIDFQRFRPSLVIYERVHLSDDAKKASVELLEKAGYDVHTSVMSFIAVSR